MNVSIHDNLHNQHDREGISVVFHDEAYIDNQSIHISDIHYDMQANKIIYIKDIHYQYILATCNNIYIQ
jgi:hypothetical protein